MVPEPDGRAAATGPQAGPAKMENIVVRMENIIVRMENIVVKMEKSLVKVEKKFLYIPGRIGAATRGRNLRPFVRTQGTCFTLLVPLQNLISERRMLQDRGELSRLRMEKNLVKI